MNENARPLEASWTDWIRLGGLAVFSGIIIILGAQAVGPTFDEPTYLDCGLKGWREWTHKPLMRLGTMPFPVDLATFPLAVTEWLGIHSWDLNRDFDLALRVARTSTVFFWWMLLFAVFGVCRNLCGRNVAWLAVALVCMEPTLTSHAALATTDIASLSTVLVAWWAHLSGQGQKSFRRWILPGLGYGFALFTKASALAFVPLLVFSTDLTAWWKTGRLFDRARLRLWARDRSGMIGIGLLTVFFLVGSDWATEPTFVKWARGLSDGLLSEAMVWLSENLRIFTNAGEGLAQQIKHNLRGHGAYLIGHEAPRAFFWYFPVLLSIKLTTAGLLLLAITLSFRRLRGVCLVLVAAFCLLFLFSLNCRVQIGIRLVFPLLVSAYLLAAIGLAKLWNSKSRWIRALAVLFLVLHGIEGVGVFPQGLMFANAPWRRIGNPDWMMSDSNFDWGQGIPAAKKMIGQREQPVGLVYYGTDPAANDLAWFRRITPKKPEWDSPDGIRRFFAGQTLLVGASVARGGPLGREYAHFREAIQELSWQGVGCMHLIAFPSTATTEADLGRK